jgi:hypothetical protein
MPHIPTPIRAALGLAATAVAEARKLPETLPQLPVAAVSTAMQASLRVQQRIATFAARGDEVISQLRGTSAEPPSWATFDDAPPNSGPGPARAAFDRAEPANLEDTAEPGAAEPAHPVPASDTALATSGEPSPALDGPGTLDTDAASRAIPSKAARTAPGKVAPAKVAKAPAKAIAKAPAKAVASAPAKAAPGGKATAKAPAKKAPAKKAAKRSEPLAEAARKADPSAGPNPSTMAAEILQAHQGEAPDQQ